MSQILDSALDAKRIADCIRADQAMRCDPRDEPEDEHAAQLRKVAASITGEDLLGELDDVRDEIAALALKGDSATIGAVVCAIHRAYAYRVTHYLCGGDVRILPSAAQAGRIAMKGVA